jgi:hypothetical protein
MLQVLEWLCQRRLIFPSRSQMQHSLSSLLWQTHSGFASSARYGRACVELIKIPSSSRENVIFSGDVSDSSICRDRFTPPSRATCCRKFLDANRGPSPAVESLFLERDQCGSQRFGVLNTTKAAWPTFVSLCHSASCQKVESIESLKSIRPVDEWTKKLILPISQSCMTVHGGKVPHSSPTLDPGIWRLWYRTSKVVDAFEVDVSVTRKSHLHLTQRVELPGVIVKKRKCCFTSSWMSL